MFGNEDPRDQGRWPKVNVRVKNFSPFLNLKDLKSFYIGKFVRVTGTVIRMGSVKPIVLDLDFECMRCNGRQTLHLVDGKYNPPTSCPTPSCRSKLFQPLRNTANTEDFQTLRIQEILSPEVNNAESGRVPRSVQVHLHGDLVDSCVPGDNIQVCGVVRAINTDVPIRGKKPDKGFSFQLHCIL
jgi:DNA helicase MCM8